MKSKSGIFLLLGAFFTALIIWYILPSNSKNEQAGLEINIPQFNEIEKKGQTAFNKFCIACHGDSGTGTQNGPPLIHKIYEPSHHGDVAFELAAKQGVRAHHWNFGNMPPVEDISNEQINNIINYIRKIQRANGIN